MSTTTGQPVQLDLFDRGDNQQPAGQPARWIGHRGPWGKNLTWTREDMPGLVVRHCGHPTALRPYYLTGEVAEDTDRWTYINLRQAQAAAVELWRTKARTTNAHPVAST